MRIFEILIVNAFHFWHMQYLVSKSKKIWGIKIRWCEITFLDILWSFQSYFVVDIFVSQYLWVPDYASTIADSNHWTGCNDTRHELHLLIQWIASNIDFNLRPTLFCKHITSFILSFRNKRRIKTPLLSIMIKKNLSCHIYSICFFNLFFCVVNRIGSLNM